MVKTWGILLKPLNGMTEDDYHDMLADVRTAVSCWTENTMEEGNPPSLDGFCEYYPEWDHSELHEVIEAEITRIREIVEQEQLEQIMYMDDEGGDDEISQYACW
jgi:hypothetical protein